MQLMKYDIDDFCNATVYKRVTTIGIAILQVAVIGCDRHPRMTRRPEDFKVAAYHHVIHCCCYGQGQITGPWTRLEQ